MMKKFHLQTGFHLIEILITLTLTAIVSHWMLSNYQYSIAKARRREAQQALLAASSAMEDYAIQHTGYSGATLKKLHLTDNIAAKNYKLVITTVGTNDFQLAAHPLGTQAALDARCGTLSLTSTGEKIASGAGGASECW